MAIQLQSYNTGTANKNYSDIIINNNTISNILGNTATTGQSQGWGILMNGCNPLVGPILIHDNVIHDMGADVNPVLTGGGNAWQCENCDSVHVYNNVAYNCFKTGTVGDGGGAYDIDYGNTNCKVYNNYGYNLDGFLLGCYSNGAAYTGNEFRNNIGINVARSPFGAIFVSGTAPYLFANNTVITASSSPVVCLQTNQSPTAMLFNNVFIAPVGVPTMIVPSTDVVTGMKMDGNYHQSGDGMFAAQNAAGTTFNTLSAWTANTGFETNGVAAEHCYFVEPKPIPTTLAGAAAAIAPISGSPLLNAGANLLGLYGVTPSPVDCAGNPWTQNSIGAIYAAGSPTAYASELYSLSPLARFRVAEVSGTDGGDSVGTFQDLVYANVTLGGAAGSPRRIHVGESERHDIQGNWRRQLACVCTPSRFVCDLVQSGGRQRREPDARGVLLQWIVDRRDRADGEQFHCVRRA